MINNHPETKDGFSDAKDELEKYAVELIVLMGTRWNSICVYRKLWSQDRAAKRKLELELIAKDYPELEKLQMEQSECTEFANQLFCKHNQLIEEQETLIWGLEDLHNELVSICELRENVYVLAQTLFIV